MDVYKNDYINSTIEFMNATASDSQIKTFKLNKGDVLATKDSETPDDIAVSAYVEEDFDNVICGYHLTHIKPNSKNLIGLFLFRLLQSKNYCQYFTTLARGVTRYALNTSAFSEMPTIVPPIKEQTAIANYLYAKTTEIDQTIADKEVLINLFEEEKKASINETVTKGLNPKVKLKPSGIDWLGDIPEHWEVKKLKYVISIKSGDSIATTDVSDEYIIPVYGGNGIMGYTTKSNSTCKELIIGRVGAYCGNVYLSDAEKWISDNALRVSTNQIWEFMFHFLKALDLNKYASQNAQPLITGSLVKDQYIPVPPIKEQTSIVQYIEKETTNINEKITLTKQEIELLKEYRQALIFEAVTGKICVL